MLLSARLSCCRGGVGVMTGSGVRSVVCEGPRCGFPVPVGFGSCREEIAGALREFCNRWCWRGHVGSGALNGWKLRCF